MIDKFVRPALLYEIPHILHSLAAGFILAKLAADIVYYILAYVGRTARIRYSSLAFESPERHPISSQQKPA